MDWVYDDGGSPPPRGRRLGNCVPRALAIAAGLPYCDVVEDLNTHGANRGDIEHYGMSSDVIARYLGRRGWTWVLCARVHFPSTQLDDLPARGRLLVLVCGHLFAVVDGAIHDIADPRDGDGLGKTGSNLPVYGFYYHRANERARMSA